MKFIRKNGRVIPIKDAASGHDKVAKMKKGESDRSTKKAVAGTAIGAGAGALLSKKLGVSKKVGAFAGGVVGAIGSRLAGAKNNEKSNAQESYHKNKAEEIRSKLPKKKKK